VESTHSISVTPAAALSQLTMQLLPMVADTQEIALAKLMDTEHFTKETVKPTDEFVKNTANSKVPSVTGTKI